MKIRYVSDLHLEGMRDLAIEKMVERTVPTHPDDIGSVLVIAGDLCSDMQVCIKFLQHVERNFKKVIYVPGNHEYYGYNYDAWNESFNTKANKELHNTIWACDEVVWFEFDNINFFLATLWADGGLTATEAHSVQYGLNDFRYITVGGINRDFTVRDMQEIHQAQFIELQSKLLNCYSEGNGGPVVVITHHLPSYELCHPRFGTDINGGFASDSDQLFSLANYWIHGHTHDTISVVKDGCHIVANPHGYGREVNSSYYNTFGYKFIEV